MFQCGLKSGSATTYIRSNPLVAPLEEEDWESETEEAASDEVLLELNPCRFITVR